MKQRLYIFIILFFAVFGFVNAQENERMALPNKIYSDRVTDESGTPLSGLTVRVKGKGLRTTTNANGEFSINAKNGDVIELSKNGKVINTYRLDGSIYYEVQDESGVLDDELNDAEADEAKKTSSVSKLRKRDEGTAFNEFLDSARDLKKSNPTKSIDQIREALLIADSNNNKQQLAASYDVLGDVYTNLKQYDLAANNYKVSIENVESTTVLLKLADAYLLNKEYKNSENTFKRVLEKREISDDQKILAYKGLGDVYLKSKKYNDAIAQYQTALKLAQKQKNTSQITDLNTKISSAFEASGQIVQAENFLNLAKTNVRAQSPKEEAIQSQRTADFYSRNNNIDKEVQQRKQTLKNLEEADVNEVVSEDIVLNKPKAKLELGNALIKQNNFKEAIPILEESASEAESTEDILTQKNAVQRLSEVYATLGDDNKALNNYQKYVSLVDKLYQQKEDEINAIVSLNKELSEKQNRITSLEKDRELTESKYKLFETENELTAENDRRQKIIIYALLGGLLLLLFSLFWMIRSNKQRRLANNLLALKSLRTQMNPHFIFNALNSVNSFIAQNDERTANRYLTDFSTLMRSVLNNSEEDFISLEKEIELLELYLKLEHSRFKDKFDYELTIDKNIDQGQFQIPPMLLQPYVENAVWHGLRYKKEKGFLKVSLDKVDDETIKIEISDNGIGRSKSKALKTEHQKKQKSKGMQNIKQRIKILNQMYKDKVDVFIEDMYDDKTGTKVVLILKKD
ncbi:histidine kinase [Aureibaculum sp. 2210JD6-5]|uniref:tetratricopeptide repeat-containing sensor histidine kinase n=1 Tax=Aureibaculum sp. 2210JD6-5 TaxID=3103957 RepID=UPI002AAD684F|nr:histidine kinase [Aureibaculum sp. 2210JD6-5]MDY7396247.1 histidine kinase [Aureibaculum sp. 2210JD6-5]